MIKRVSHDSEIDRFYFFLNDIYLLNQNLSVYSYADESTIGSIHDDVLDLKRSLETSSGIVLTGLMTTKRKEIHSF